MTAKKRKEILRKINRNIVSIKNDLDDVAYILNKHIDDIDILLEETQESINVLYETLEQVIDKLIDKLYPNEEE